MAKRVTMSEVARAAGVSIATVSLVLNSRYKAMNITEATAEIVRATAARLNYTPNHAASSLRRSRTNTITIFLLDLLNPYYPEIARSARKTAALHGYKLQVVETHGVEAELEVLRDLGNGDSDGVIIATTWHRYVPEAADVLRQTVARGLCAVTLIDYSIDPAIPTIRNDDEGGAFEATTHLIGLGHQRIAYLNYATLADLELGRKAHTVDRYRGYRRALSEAGIPFNPEDVIRGVADASGGKAMVEELLARDAPVPSGIFCFNDQIAIGAIRALFESGIRVPEDIAVIGFGGTTASAYTTPALTTVEHSREDLGRMAVETLVDLLEERTPEEMERVLPGRLLVRESCGALKKPAGKGDGLRRREE